MEVKTWYFEYRLNFLRIGVGVNATSNNISVISWRPVSLVEETGLLGENHRPTASHRQILLHNVVSSTHRMSRIRNQTDTKNLKEIRRDLASTRNRS
jgi:hypothetical protein